MDIPEYLFSNFTCVSWDSDHGMSMLQDDRPVINFDGMAEMHAKHTHYNKFESVDALFLENDNKRPWFIEFKNGRLRGKELRQKACASLLIAMHLGIIHDLKDAQNRAGYILVYNPEHACRHRDLLDQHGEQPSSEPYLQPKVQHFSWLFKSAFSYTPEQFRSHFLEKL